LNPRQSFPAFFWEIFLKKVAEKFGIYFGNSYLCDVESLTQNLFSYGKDRFLEKAQ
jgi:hypothetical protein